MAKQAQRKQPLKWLSRICNKNVPPPGWVYHRQSSKWVEMTLDWQLHHELRRWKPPASLTYLQ